MCSLLTKNIIERLSETVRSMLNDNEIYFLDSGFVNSPKYYVQ